MKSLIEKIELEEAVTLVGIKTPIERGIEKAKILLSRAGGSGSRTFRMEVVAELKDLARQLDDLIFEYMK